MKLSDPYNVSDFQARANSVAIMFGTLLFLLLIRLWYLQIWQGELYREFSDRNRYKSERLSAPRGQLIDRNGELIADSRPKFDLTITRGNTQNIDGEFLILKDIFKWDPEEFQKKKDRVLKSNPNQPQLLVQDLSYDELALVQSQGLELAGVDIEVNAVRDYLYNEIFFHVVGYTREINEEDLEKFQEIYKTRNYRQGDQKGVTGIESLYEPVLRGHDGRDLVVVDARGRRVNQDDWSQLPKTDRIEPIAGRSLQLSLDLNLQIQTYKALEGKIGAAVAMDPSTGEILAYVSRPALDPNAFSKVISGKDFDEWMNRPDKPYLDRVVSEHYPPGSTLKLAMAVAALQSGVISDKTNFSCPGHYRLGNHVWSCWVKEGHGKLNIVQAIERSCDVFFYNVGQALGLDLMHLWGSRLGLGRQTYIGSELVGIREKQAQRFNSESPGNIPSSDWVQSRGNTTVEAETINAAIGQGGFTVTALQLARMVSAITGSGKVFQPQLVLSSQDSMGGDIQHYKARIENEIVLKPEVKELVLQGMNLVVNGANGTSKVARIAGVEFGGKTGTAQVVRVELQKKYGKSRKEFGDHALFVGAAPLHAPRIAVAIIVENGGHGWAAGLIAKQMIESYLKRVAQKEEVHGK
jgi:penicillin-binding protein 2